MAEKGGGGGRGRGGGGLTGNASGTSFSGTRGNRSVTARPILGTWTVRASVGGVGVYLQGGRGGARTGEFPSRAAALSAASRFLSGRQRYLTMEQARSALYASAR
jgi:hypothetical protein